LTDHSNIASIIETVLSILEPYEDHFRSTGRIRIFNRRKATSLLNLAKVRIGLGDRREGRRLLREAVKLDPLPVQNYITYLISLVPHRLLALARGRTQVR
jgi:hypothetical protein